MYQPSLEEFGAGLVPLPLREKGTKILLRKSENCTVCGVHLSLSEGPYYLYFDHGANGKGKYLYLYQCCSCCQDRDIEMQEAYAADRRCTAIGVMTRRGYGTGYERCVCGAVTLTRFGACVQCDKERRMLDRAQSENRMIVRVLKELRTAIRDKKRETEIETN